MLAANRQTAPATWAALVQLFGEENARYHLERSAAIITVTPAMLHTHWAVLVAVFGEEVRPAAHTFMATGVVIAAGSALRMLIRLGGSRK